MGATNVEASVGGRHHPRKYYCRLREAHNELVDIIVGPATNATTSQWTKEAIISLAFGLLGAIIALIALLRYLWRRYKFQLVLFGGRIWPRARSASGALVPNRLKWMV